MSKLATGEISVAEEIGLILICLKCRRPGLLPQSPNNLRCHSVKYSFM